MWLDRLTGEQFRQLPEIVEPGRYQHTGDGPAFNGHTPVFTGVLVSDGGERCQLGNKVHTFSCSPQAQFAELETLCKAVAAIDVGLSQDPLMSPLMPAAIIDTQSNLLPFEEHLLGVVQQGHLHQISQRPRLDLHYEDEVADVGRARRLAKGALVHLASHSELWQRQTLSGIIPKKVLARFSEDDYGIYENRVYARLLDKTERHLRGRLSALKGLQATLDQALKLYESEGVDFRLSREVCRLWGDTFDQAATSRVSELLSQTLGSLESLFRVISGLRQSGVYLLVSRQAQVVGALHLTNILSHDPHYRHLALLWDLLDQTTSATRSSPEELFSRNQYLASAYSRYAGLVLCHALRPYLAGQYEGIWAGRCIRLQQSGLDWQLISVVSGEHASEEVLLTVVPWLADAHFLDESLQLPLERFIAWPAIGQEPQRAAYHGQWVPLSPSDMYCVERFGLLVDRALYRMVVRSYGQPLTKIPVKALVVADGINGLHVDRQNHALELREAISRDSIAALKGALVAANSSRQAEALERHNQEIIALEKCPVCEVKGNLFFQSPIGFRANCNICGTERYLRREGSQLVFDQTVAGRKGFVALGRRAFSLDVSRTAASTGLI